MTTQIKPLAVSILQNGVIINGTPIGAAGPPNEFYAIFGTPDRICDACSTPAPFGHRNNHFHYFDAQGVTLNEHHYTHQIQAINFVFNTELAAHPTVSPFNGEMNVGDLRISVGTLERQIADSIHPFTAQLPGTWFATIQSAMVGKPIVVAVSTVGPKLKSGRRSKVKVIVEVSLCLAHDPWDATHRPQRST